MSTEKRTVQVGLLGLGTVGSGVIKSLLQNQQSIQDRTGYEVSIPYILVRDPLKPRLVDVLPEQLTADPEKILQHPDISIVIEVMGGVEPARSILLAALRSGKHVITANKELLAKHGAELFQAAAEAGVQLLFEASVAGGIPVIRFLQGYLTANRVQEISGILNGTSNYILTQMEETGHPFTEVLQQAQQLGYAEADPTNDIEGLDTAYKLAILTNLAFEVKVPVYDMKTWGITNIDSLDLRWARQFGYVVKLIGRSRKVNDQIDFSVGPRLLPLSHPLARVNDVFNAVTISSDVVGDLTFIGKGAGEYPTASAVIEDLTALLRQPGNVLRPANWINPSNFLTASDLRSDYYVRIITNSERKNAVSQSLSAWVTGMGGEVHKAAEAIQGNEQRLGFILGNLSFQSVEAYMKLQLENGQFIESACLIPIVNPNETTPAATQHSNQPEPVSEYVTQSV